LTSVKCSPQDVLRFTQLPARTRPGLQRLLVLVLSRIAGATRDFQSAVSRPAHHTRHPIRTGRCCGAANSEHSGFCMIDMTVRQLHSIAKESSSSSSMSTIFAGGEFLLTAKRDIFEREYPCPPCNARHGYRVLSPDERDEVRLQHWNSRRGEFPNQSSHHFASHTSLVCARTNCIVQGRMMAPRPARAARECYRRYLERTAQERLRLTARM
jgi:hypothetical protein